VSGRRASLYLRAHRVFKRVLAGLDAAWAGLWLGALRREDLFDVDTAYYLELDRYRSDEHNRHGLFAWEEASLRDCFPPSGRLLVTAAGGGREVLALAARGYEVDGFECNPGLVAYATDLLARDGVAATVRLLPPDRAPAAGGPYDGAIVGWGSYMLVPGRARRVAFLRELRALLPPGAPILLSFFTREPGTPRHRIVAAVARVVRRLRGGEPIEVGDDLTPNYLHPFTEPEIASELADGGFRIARFRPQGADRYETGFAIAHAEPAQRGEES
jgi:hypothetical protein